MYKDIKDVVHYVAYRMKDSPDKLGATKLNKILWFVDQYHFMETGKSLTNTRYVKRQYGPAPEFQAISNAIVSLQAEGHIKLELQNFHGYSQQSYVPQSEPSIELTPVQENLLNDVIDIIACKHTANSITEISHNDIWEIAEDGEELPVYTCLVAKSGRITDEMQAWAKQCVA